jgi:hypothetical protein
LPLRQPHFLTVRSPHHFFIYINFEWTLLKNSLLYSSDPFENNDIHWPEKFARPSWIFIFIYQVLKTCTCLKCLKMGNNKNISNIQKH